MEIVQLTEENIDTYHLVTRLKRSREKLINQIESDIRNDCVTWVYLDKVHLPWPSAYLGPSLQRYPYIKE